MAGFDGFEVSSCDDVKPGMLRLVSHDGSRQTIILGDPIPDAGIRWRRFELSPGDYQALERQVQLR